MNYSIGIAIPSYNSPDLLQKCLQSLQNQTYKNFSTYIFDDASSIDLKPVINSFPDLKILYKRNSNNLGALKNMSFAYQQIAISSHYVMVMHEDDLLAPNFIESTLSILNSCQSDPAFIITSFMELKPNQTSFIAENFLSDFTCVNQQQLCYRFLKNNNLAFGSVFYNTRVVKEINFDFHNFEEFADRPFLLTLLKEGYAYINENQLYGLRSHQDNDTRWKRLKIKHIINLLIYYKNILLDTKNTTKKEFKTLSTGFFIDSYINLKFTNNPPNYLLYIIAGYRKGMLSSKYLFLKNSFINKIATKIFK